jgi:glycosyltransferase involved in cell wall biosynthesis
MFDVALIIPCYNDGDFLTNAIESIDNYAGSLKLQIIVVNDGSTDKHTIDVLADLQKKYASLVIINQENKKMSAARNAGIKAASASLFIPLDADDILNVEFIDKAFELINKDNTTGVVYGNCEYFGEKSGVDVKNFNEYSQFYVNGINITTLVRKAVWEQCGGFDEQMTEGYEDWEFWIHAMKQNWKFEKVDIVAFKYRIKKQSTNVDAINKHQQLLRYIQTKHLDLFNKKYISLNRQLHDIKNNRKKLIHYLIRNLFGKVS